MSTSRVVAVLSLACCAVAISCNDPRSTAPPPIVDPELVTAPVELPSPDVGPVDTLSVAEWDRPTAAFAGDATLPVEAKFLVVSANGSEPELDAIRSVLGHRGARYDVFVASSEPALTADRLRTGTRGHYQATILMSSSLTISGSSALSSSEWAVLADYEATFAIRRAVLAASPDPALGFAGYTTQNTSSAPLSVRCTTAGQAVFRDVHCAASQQIAGDTAYLATRRAARR